MITSLIKSFSSASKSLMIFSQENKFDKTVNKTLSDLEIIKCFEILEKVLIQCELVFVK